MRADMNWQVLTAALPFASQDELPVQAQLRGPRTDGLALLPLLDPSETVTLFNGSHSERAYRTEKDRY
jgi:hypothetical protein